MSINDDSGIETELNILFGGSIQNFQDSSVAALVLRQGESRSKAYSSSFRSRIFGPRSHA